MSNRQKQFPGIQAKEVPSRCIITEGISGEIKAAEGEGKLPTLHLKMNTGKPMRLRGYYDPVIVNIQGAKFDKSVTPIIMDHDTSKRVGYTTVQKIDGKSSLITADGVASSTSTFAKEFIADALGGFPFQTSIGATIVKGYSVEPGQTVTVNGKTWNGPLIVAEETLIRELTVTVLGADNDTSVKVTAKENVMDFEAFVKECGLDITALSAEQKSALQAQFNRQLELQKRLEASEKKTPATKKKAAPVRRKIAAQADPDDEDDEDEEDDDIQAKLDRQAAQEERLEEISILCSEYSDTLGEKTVEYKGKEMTLKSFKAAAIRNRNMTASEVELALLRASRYEPTGAPSVHSKDSNIDSKALECSLLRYMSIPEEATNERSGKKFGILAMGYSEKDLEASQSKKYNHNGRISALFDMQIRAAGKYAPTSDRTSKEFMACVVNAWEDVTLKASGFSTLNITNILENVANKIALASFQNTEGVGLSICAKRSLNDFKAQSLYRLDVNGHFKKVDQSGELKHVTMVDEKKTIQADTYGAMITIDRKTMKNDDLGMVLQAARSIGTLAALRLEESIFVTLLSNPSSFFHANNKNLISGGSSVLGLTAMATARKAFLDQVLNGKPIGVSPSLLLVGTALADMANNLYTEDKFEIAPATGTFNKNPNKGLFRPIVTPYLNNTNITDENGAALSGQSDTQWYLFAGPDTPQGAALTVGFVDGRETPYFDEAETQFNVPGGLQMRSYMDWGVAMHVTQLAFKSAGA